MKFKVLPYRRRKKGTNVNSPVTRSSFLLWGFGHWGTDLRRRFTENLKELSASMFEEGG
jgi:hypothetical protein